jgi:uncharacterized protein
MGRLLVLIVLIVIAAWLLRRALRKHDRAADAPSVKPTEELVRCARCGLLLPRGEACVSAGRAYCTEEHARLGPAAR